jgi:hypothetical protein
VRLVWSGSVLPVPTQLPARLVWSESVLPVPTQLLARLVKLAWSGSAVLVPPQSPLASGPPGSCNQSIYISAGSKMYRYGPFIENLRGITT